MIGLDNPIHILLLLVVVLLVFGAKRLPEMGRSLGSGLRSFKESISGETPPGPPAQLSPRNGDEAVRAEGERAETRAAA